MANARIPFLDVAAAYAELREEIDTAVRDVGSSGRFILGPDVAAFEEEFAAYCGTRHAIGVGNGLDALRLILLGYGVGPGDEVIVPSNTFIATWLAISQTGAAPVPVDPDPLSHNITAEAAARAITPSTRAIMPVHLYGHPADMDALAALGGRHGIPVIEDAAQAQGATCRGRRAGGLGDAAGFSFYPGKNLGALGDAGAVTTDDEGLAERLRSLRNYGSTVKYHHDLAGVNSRLDSLQAAVLRVKLRHLDEWNERRRETAALYLERLGDLEGVTLPVVAEWAEPVWHLFVVRHRERDVLQQQLAESGVDTIIHYPIPPHRSGAYAAGFAERGLPVAERLADEVLSLPMGPHLTRDEGERVARSVREAVTVLKAGTTV